MRKFCIGIRNDSNIFYNNYLSSEFIKKKVSDNDYEFKQNYPLKYSSRRFDKPAIKYRDGTSIWKLDGKWHIGYYFTEFDKLAQDETRGWCLDDKLHRVGKPACVYHDGTVECYENGERVK